MRIAILGTGVVGQTLGRKLTALGHDVTMGARSATNEKAAGFASETGARHGTFADAAEPAEVIFVATNGAATLAALDLIPPQHLAGKILVDVSNPLDFSAGFPPSLLPEFCNTKSLGEAVQAAHPAAYVVKTLNTVNCDIMVDPGQLSETGEIFLSGNDNDAKAMVSGILNSFGWAEPVDLGDISTARATEQYLILWTRLIGPMGGAGFNIKLVR